MRSSSTASGDVCSTAWSPSAPSTAVTTSRPADSRYCVRSSRVSASSSTTRTRPPSLRTRLRHRTRSRSSRSTGLVSRSTAPRSRPRPSAATMDTITTGIFRSASSSLKSLRASHPVMSGIMRSRVIRFGRSFRASSIPSRADRAVWTRQPNSSRCCAMRTRESDSSSITSTFMFDGSSASARTSSTPSLASRRERSTSDSAPAGVGPAFARIDASSAARSSLGFGAASRSRTRSSARMPVRPSTRSGRWAPCMTIEKVEPTPTSDRTSSSYPSIWQIDREIVSPRPVPP